jgi:hypothetical protein
MNEVLRLQEVAELKRGRRRSSHGGGTKTVCLISLNDSLNGLTANVLNIFGGAF